MTIINRILILLSCLFFFTTVQAQKTNEELYKKWKSIYDAQHKNGQREKNTNVSKRKERAVKSVPTKPIKSVSPNTLRKYSVVAVSYELLSNAQRQCQRLIERGYPAMIYLDSKDYYRVIAGSFSNEQEALKLRRYIIDEYPDTWILCVEKGVETKYIQEQRSDINHVYELIENMPSFPGGDAELMKFLHDHMKYPVAAEKNGIQGRVICTFVVERDGSITDVNVIKSVDPSLDNEAIRVLKSMPKWIPGKQNGSAVRVKYTVPITFRLQ